MTKEATARPSVEDLEEKLVEVRKEAKQTIDKMTNKAAVAHYKDEDSIAIMYNEVNMVLVRSNKRGMRLAIEKSEKRRNKEDRRSIAVEEQSVASSVIIESLLSKQSQTEVRLDKMDSALS